MILLQLFKLTYNKHTNFKLLTFNIYLNTCYKLHFYCMWRMVYNRLLQYLYNMFSCKINTTKFTEHGFVKKKREMEKEIFLAWFSTFKPILNEHIYQTILFNHGMIIYVSNKCRWFSIQVSKKEKWIYFHVCWHDVQH